ncbi:MAG: aminoacyl-histidine dipeptidase [Turicibacter sp.]|nr:aminoacyl-histidine dipeptidase [Turicibacter sp.]
MKLSNLQPADVFYYFEALTQIPRESGKERAVSDFLMAFAKEQGLDAIQEPCMNVIIKKPATPGYENAPTVIIQGHMDMVCVKEDDKDFDFDTMPIPLVVDGDWIKTEGTTLGADNGIAVAMSLALLADKKAQHPALEVLVTVEEETGMDGALYLNPENLSGTVLINIDSDHEGIATVSCAGGGRYVMELPLGFEAVPQGLQAFKVVISGLKGGHSGVEIGEGRANSNKLMARLLDSLAQEGIRIAALMGGEKDNAISKRAEMVVLAESAEQVEAIAQKFEKTVAGEFLATDPDISISAQPVALPEITLTKESAQKAISLLLLAPFGPQTMSGSIPGLVESSNNPGVVRQEGDKLVVTNAVRSSVGSLKLGLYRQLQTIADLVGATTKLQSDYPEWQYAPKSRIRDLMMETYPLVAGKDLKIEAIHAGLECGFLGEKLGELDMVSIGPDMMDIHTPKERLSISSTGRVYQFLKETLKALK